MWIRYNGHLRLLIGIIHSVRLPISDTARDVTFKRPEERKRGEEKKNKKNKKSATVFEKKFHESFIFVSRFHFVGLNQRRNNERGAKRKKERKKGR